MSVNDVEDLINSVLLDESPIDRLRKQQNRKTAEEIKASNMFDDMIGSNGKITASDGTLIGSVSVEETCPHTFSVSKWKIKIPGDVWDKIEFECEGNAVEVTTSPLPDDRYKVEKVVRGFKPDLVREEESITLKKFDNMKEFMKWAEKLDTDTLEAYRQIYYDRWCFHTGNEDDQMHYRLLEDEKNTRK